MDCWIGIVEEGTRRVVRLAGRLTVEQVPELLEVCGDEAPPLKLDLSDLASADMAGIDVLQRLRADGAMVLGAPGYIQLKLDTPQGGSGPFPVAHRDRTG